MTSEARQIKCPACQRDMQIEERNGLRLVSLVGVPAAKCCEKAASDGYKVACAFSTRAA
jgi:hypothetical protein